MKAKTLSEVYDSFDPQEPLKGEKLKTYYVDRKSKIKEEVLWKIKSSRRPLKILFTGTRGNGNTTELNKLAEEARKELFVIFFSTKNRLDVANLTYVDLLLNVGLQIYGHIKNKIEIDPQLEDALGTWSSRIIEKVREEQEVFEVGGGISALLKLVGAMKSQASTREIIRRKVEPKLSELLDIINRMITHAEEKLGKIFVIVDDLGKMVPEQMEDLFFRYSATLTQLQCSVLYTASGSLQLRKKYLWPVRYFDYEISIPIMHLFDKNGNLIYENKELMKNVALYRMKEDLIDEDALEYAVEMSGGVLHDFVRIIRESAAKAHGNNNSKIEKDDVELVASSIRNENLRFLWGDDLEMLKMVAATHKKLDVKRFNDLFFSLVILEYLNNEVWYDVHPIVKGVLE